MTHSFFYIGAAFYSLDADAVFRELAGLLFSTPCNVSAHTDGFTVEVWGESSYRAEFERIMSSRHQTAQVSRRDVLELFGELLAIRRDFLEKHGPGQTSNEGKSQVHQIA